MKGQKDMGKPICPQYDGHTICLCSRFCLQWRHRSLIGVGGCSEMTNKELPNWRRGFPNFAKIQNRGVSGSPPKIPKWTCHWFGTYLHMQLLTNHVHKNGMDWQGCITEQTAPSKSAYLGFWHCVMTGGCTQEGIQNINNVHQNTL